MEKCENWVFYVWDFGSKYTACVNKKKIEENFLKWTEKDITERKKKKWNSLRKRKK